MRSRVLHRYEWCGAPAEAVALLDACVSAALSRRERTLADEEDPRFLHPARTVLILLDDAEVRSAPVLGAAALVESEEAELALDADALRALPADATGQAALVPLPRTTGERLAEELVAAAAETRLIACAERLDQARHAHLLPRFDAGRWLAETRAVYLPVAVRTHPLLATRFDRWASALERRLGRG